MIDKPPQYFYLLFSSTCLFVGQVPYQLTELFWKNACLQELSLPPPPQKKKKSAIVFSF